MDDDWCRWSVMAAKDGLTKRERGAEERRRRRKRDRQLMPARKKLVPKSEEIGGNGGRV